MQKICLDTNIVVDFLRGENSIQIFQRLKQGEVKLFLSSITMFELYLGAFLSAKHRESVEDVRDLLQWFEIIEINDDVSYISAKITAHLKKQGLIIEIKDILIASCALSKNLSFMTKNRKHFKNIVGLEMID